MLRLCRKIRTTKTWLATRYKSRSTSNLLMIGKTTKISKRSLRKTEYLFYANGTYLPKAARSWLILWTKDSLSFLLTLKKSLILYLKPTKISIIKDTLNWCCKISMRLSNQVKSTVFILNLTSSSQTTLLL